MRYLSFAEVVELHRLVIEAAGGSQGLRDLGALESAVAPLRPGISPLPGGTSLARNF